MRLNLIQSTTKLKRANYVYFLSFNLFDTLRIGPKLPPKSPILFRFSLEYIFEIEPSKYNALVQFKIYLNNNAKLKKVI